MPASLREQHEIAFSRHRGRLQENIRRRRFQETAAEARGTDTDLIRVEVEMHPYTAHCVKEGWRPLRNQQHTSGIRRLPGMGWNAVCEKDGTKEVVERRRVIVEGGSRKPKTRTLRGCAPKRPRSAAVTVSERGERATRTDL